MKKLLFPFLCLFTSFSFAQNITGTWKGDIEIQNNRLPIVFHLERNGDSLSGTWDSPAQNAFQLSFSTLRIKKDSLIATIENLSSTYLGRFVGDDSVSGEWKQGPMTFPLSLKWSAPTSSAEKVEDANDGQLHGVAPSSKYRISGTLLSRSTNEPLVIIIAGSGPTDRNGNNPLGVSSDSYRLLARDLYKNHISTFRYDKRGIARSSAGHLKQSDLRFTDFSNDADAIVDHFRKKGFQKIFIAGHSEGSLLGMLVAEKENLQGYISISGAGMPADEILKKQLSGKIPGVSDSTIDRILTTVKEGKTLTNVPPSLLGLFNPSILPYIHSWFQYDPRTDIKKITCPILILQGTCDVQVSVDNATDLFNAARRATIKIIPGMSHVLKDAGKGCVNEQATYTDPSLPISPDLTGDIVNFVTDNSK